MACEVKNAHLASIHDFEENHLANIFNYNTASMWIGLRRQVRLQL